MKFRLPQTYQHLLHQAAGFANRDKPHIENLLSGFVSQTLPFHADALIFYAVDYTRHKYLYIDPCFTSILGYDINFIKKEGPSYFTGLWHENDFRIFNEHIFPNTMEFLKQQGSNEAERFSVSFNFRIVNLLGHYQTMLQRSTYYIEEERGTPLGAVGFLVDISQFKDNSTIVHTIEKINNSYISVTKVPLVRNVYYPDAINNSLSRREVEILKCIVKGLTSRKIAEELSLSLHTINNHRKNILEKTATKNICELVQFASTRGIT